MKRSHLKVTVGLIIVGLILVFSMFTLRQIGELIVYFREGADPASALNIQPNKPLDWPIELTWRPDADYGGRILEPQSREAIESAYMRAWLQWHFSYIKGEPYGLGTYFNGPALEAIEASVVEAAEQNLKVMQTDARHDLELTYYSADGAIATFTDHQAQVIRMVEDEEGELIFSAETNAIYDIVMLLDNGRWRIRHWLRKSQVAPQQEPRRASLDIDLAGINYYPQATPWSLFWPEYEPEIITADFERMSALGLNSLRIFIPFEQFGSDVIDEALLKNVLALLDEAERQELGVIVTLFDFRSDYALLRWNHSDAHLAAIVPALKDHPALLAWDIKNEPDRDYKYNEQALVDAWLKHSIEELRRIDNQTPITIGWSLPEKAAVLSEAVDFVSFHYYAPADQFDAAYNKLRADVGDFLPIVLTEFGLPTWNSYFFPNGHSAAEQAAYFADIRRAMGQTDIAGYLAWTLYDFTEVPGNVAGTLPWQRGPQRHLGLFDTAGNPKPAAALIAPDAAYDAIDPISDLARFAKPFWQSVGLFALLFLVVSAYIWRKITRSQR